MKLITLHYKIAIYPQNLDEFLLLLPYSIGLENIGYILAYWWLE